MAKAFGEVRKIMVNHGRLILRTTVKDQFTFLYWVEEIKQRINGRSTDYKTVDRITSALVGKGFGIEKIEPSSKNGDMVWIVASAR